MQNVRQNLGSARERIIGELMKSTDTRTLRQKLDFAFNAGVTLGSLVAGDDEVAKAVNEIATQQPSAH